MKQIISVVLCFCSILNYAQTTSEVGVWLDHLPYGAGVDLVQRGEKVYVAVEQGMFILHTADKDLQRLSKLNGLSDVGVTAMAYSDLRDEVILGYSNANMDIIKGDEVFNVPDITLSANFPGLKTINHLYAFDDLVYISTDFGIVVMDLEARIIKEHYIIGEGGNTLKVNQVVIDPLTDKIYAATDLGMFSASRNSALQYFKNWSRDSVMNTIIKQTTYFKDKVFINKKGGDNQDSIFMLDSGSWVHIPEISPGTYDFMRAERGILVMCNEYAAQGFDENFNLKYNLNNSIVGFPQFNPQAGVVDNNPESFWVVDASLGLFLNYQTFSNQQFLPNSPAFKSVFSLSASEGKLYVAPGAMDDVWGPQYNNQGFYVLENYSWENFRREDIGNYQDIVAIIADPSDPEHFYASSYGNGILEFRDNAIIRTINSSTLGENILPSINGSGFHRIGGFSYDPEGNLWFSNSLTDNPLGVIYKDGSVESFSLGSALSSSVAIRDIMYTSEDQIWIQTRTEGIVVTQKNGQSFQSKKLEAQENKGNLPTETVFSFAEDKDGEIWVGTNQGVAVLYSPQNIFEPNRNFDTQKIIIDEDGDGLGEPFLGGESVNDIEVDGSNKKWFATSNSGVFYTSADGREEIYHFTKENSPLLSNNVLDIEVDGETGMVYFGTDQGIVSFQGVATEGSDFNEDIYAYPNPVEPGYEGPILIRGMVSNAQVKITDIEGNIVFETLAEGGQAIWSGRNFDGKRAKSGVYLAYITNDLGTSTAITKILIVN